MFTKKIFTTLLLTPLFVGCVVDTGDDDDGAETGDTDPTATMTDPSATMTDPSATMTDPSATMTDPSVGTESGSESGSETADTGATTDGTGGGDAMFCAPTCAAPEDCCAMGDPNCGMPPFSNYECNEGFCDLIGCLEDGDCTIIAGTTCHQVGGFGACVPLCTVETEAEDCLTDQGETCTGMTDDAMLYCVVEAEPPAPCEDDKVCGGFGVCNLETGFCECTDGAQCPEGYDCTGA
jgi:hypothetical protein